MRRNEFCQLQSNLVERPRHARMRIDGAQRAVRLDRPRLRHDERHVFAAAERNAHDVTDPQFQIARVVAQRQVKPRRTDRGQRVDRTN